MLANGLLRQCRSGHGRRFSFNDSWTSARYEAATDLGTWIRPWFACPLHFGCSISRPPCTIWHANESRHISGALDSCSWISKTTDGPSVLGEFDAIVTHQAVHELRHKKHATTLHRSARTLLRPRGVYLVCDHYVGSDGMSNASLYMTIDEQRAALDQASRR
jgi:hypothetical protein